MFYAGGQGLSRFNPGGVWARVDAQNAGSRNGGRCGRYGQQESGRGSERDGVQWRNTEELATYGL